MKIFIIVILPIYFALCDKAETRSYAMKFVSKAIVPDVINEIPENILSVTFLSTQYANLGNVINSRFLQEEPIIGLELDSDEDPSIDIQNSTFTVLIVNADAPIRRNPNLRNVLHYMIVNCPSDNLTAGEVKAEYLPPNPPKGSGHHRYVVLLYKHSKITFNEPKIGKNSAVAMRYKFSVKDFLKKYKLGAPFGGNFFKSAFHYD